MEKRFPKTGKTVVISHSGVVLCGSPLLHFRSGWTGRPMPVGLDTKLCGFESNGFAFCAQPMIGGEHI